MCRIEGNIIVHHYRSAAPFSWCGHDSQMLDRWQEVVYDLWPGLWVGVMRKRSFRDILWAPIPHGKSFGYQI